MGCASSKDPGDYVIPVDVPKTEEGYPAPTHPRNPRQDLPHDLDTATIDQHAAEAPSTLLNSYDSLIHHLTQHATSDLHKVRAIYAWMAAQSIHTAPTPSKVKDAGSPAGYMTTIQQGDGSCTEFFALLCRAARIPCVIVDGACKADDYEAGERDLTNQKSRWTAVHADGSWWVVHVFWALVGRKALAAPSPGHNGRPGVRHTETPRELAPDQTTWRRDDFWFLTDPGHFAYFCLADSTQWQLLRQPWSLDVFINAPLFTPYFFTSDYKLSSEHLSVLRSQHGKCDVTFDHSEQTAARLEGTLVWDDHDGYDQPPPSATLARYVIQLGTQTEKTVRVRFPARGIYTLQVWSAISSGMRTALATFRLQCDRTTRGVQPYPLNPQIGYGYTRAAVEAGLVRPSQVRGEMVAQPSETVQVSFRSRDPLEIRAVLIHTRLAAEDLAQHVVTDVTEDGEITVAVRIPWEMDNPEYALKIDARAEGSKGEGDNVANYLLTHGRDLRQRGDLDQYRRNMMRRQTDYRIRIQIRGTEYTIQDDDDEDLARQRLIAATRRRDVAELERYVAQCDRMRLADHGDLSRARRVLAALHEESLRAAAKERDLERLERAIQAAKESSVRPLLHDSDAMSGAEGVRSLLRRLKLYMHRVLDLQPMTVSEIHSYSRPKPLVHTVMKATYLLLGEMERQLQRWEYIQTLLRRRGAANIIRQIKNFDLVSVKVSSLRRAESHLQPCSKAIVNQVSAGAGTFYVWSSNIINEGKNTDLPKIEMPRRRRSKAKPSKFRRR